MIKDAKIHIGAYHQERWERQLVSSNRAHFGLEKSADPSVGVCEASKMSASVKISDRVLRLSLGGLGSGPPGRERGALLQQCNLQHSDHFGEPLF